MDEGVDDRQDERREREAKNRMLSGFTREMKKKRSKRSM
jgi:hypothetical protein